jgi:hypothetical protein
LSKRSKHGSWADAGDAIVRPPKQVRPVMVILNIVRQLFMPPSQPPAA